AVTYEITVFVTRSDSEQWTKDYLRQMTSAWDPPLYDQIMHMIGQIAKRLVKTMYMKIRPSWHLRLSIIVSFVATLQMIGGMIEWIRTIANNNYLKTLLLQELMKKTLTVKKQPQLILKRMNQQQLQDLFMMNMMQVKSNQRKIHSRELRAELYERRLFTIRTGKGLKVATRSFPFSLSTHAGNRLLIDRILYPINFSHGSSVVFHIRQLVCYKRPVSFSKTKKTAHSFRQSSSNERFIYFKDFLGKNL